MTELFKKVTNYYVNRLPKDLTPAIEIYKREENVQIDNLQIDNINLNGNKIEIKVSEV